MTQIVDRKVEFETPWFQLVSKHVAGEPAPYYALRVQDYVCVVAFTAQDELVLVRQYRPAVERDTLELPSGHVEPDEPPAESARRELAEECGLDAPRLELLGPLISDSGRNENKIWCYYAPQVLPLGPDYVPEPGVERILVPRASIPSLIARAEFDHALHVGALMLLVMKHGLRTVDPARGQGPAVD
jgi:ADP-ribose pyrophosphatase